LLLLITTASVIQAEPIPFDSGRRVLTPRSSSTSAAGPHGLAYLPDADFTDGIIKYDLAQAAFM